MNKNSILKQLNSVHEDLLATINDSSVRELVRNNSIISGGAITSMLLNEEVHDYDYYFTNKETCLAVARHYAEKFGNSVIHAFNIRQHRNQWDDVMGPTWQNIIQAVDTDDRISFDINMPEGSSENYERLHAVSIYYPVCMSQNAITLKGGVQCCIRFYGDPDEIHKNFDFAHTRCYWHSGTNMLILPHDALQSIVTRELHYIGSLYPLSSIIRTRKFIQRGWHINAGQYLKMCLQLNELDLKNLSVLKEQLTGVDQEYFMKYISMIETLEEMSTEELVALVDEVFS